MREIKFRAICKGRWVEVRVGYKYLGIERETLSQFTGLYDINGIHIYEGDLIEVRHRSATGFVREKPTNVYYEESDAAFLLKLPSREEYPMYLHEVAHSNYVTIEGCSHTCKVIGNIHKNPELLGGDS